MVNLECFINELLYRDVTGPRFALTAIVARILGRPDKYRMRGMSYATTRPLSRLRVRCLCPLCLYALRVAAMLGFAGLRGVLRADPDCQESNERWADQVRRALGLANRRHDLRRAHQQN